MSRLSGPEAQSRLEEYGPNALPEKAAKSFWRERIPADGRLVEAQGVMLDVSVLTRESVPVSARGGTPVPGTCAPTQSRCHQTRASLFRCERPYRTLP